MDTMKGDTQVSRMMPHSDESELAVIGSMILSRDAIEQASEIITAKDFYNKHYAYMFQALVDMMD